MAGFTAVFMTPGVPLPTGYSQHAREPEREIFGPIDEKRRYRVRLETRKSQRYIGRPVSMVYSFQRPPSTGYNELARRSPSDRIHVVVGF